MRAAARGSWRTRASATLPIVALALACESGTSATDEGETDGHETGGVDTDAAGPEDAPAGCELETPGPRPRLVRLTHAQYDSTVRDLLPGVDMWPSSQFIADPLHGGFDNNAAALSVTSRLARDYRRAAEEVAARAVERPHTLRAYAACLEAAGDPLELSEAAGESCARELIAAIGRRVYRRPLSDAQRQAYLERYRAGAGLYEDGAPFAQGVRLVLETMLQSPRFLYRVELSDDVAAGGDAIALDGYELATRLSYLLWNSTPDDALLDAAE
ncbi:MAG: DUF1587 domain-containing protein, partial [Myxococcales bacterium]|nr:DUF1587 domain-containing protein [Myxococcales bacterium]